MVRICLMFALLSCTLSAAELQDESRIKFAFYSAAWGGSTQDNIRMLAHNQTDSAIHLQSITFLDAEHPGQSMEMPVNLDIPAGAYAEKAFSYVELLRGNACVARTLEENWRLAEISNYTLNPSVRNLIIEDTDSFRIYQCVHTVLTQWIELDSGNQRQKQEWVLYHFESRQQ